MSWVTAAMDDRATARRRRLFAGRRTHLEMFRTAVSLNPAPFALLHLHGPGGVGKTALLDAFADLADQAGVPVRRMPPNDGEVSRDSFLAGLGPMSGDGREVLLVDGYERLGPLSGWLRTEVLPGLPDSWIIVLAGRAEPSVEWRTDPAWQGLARDVALRNLSPAEATAYLSARAVDPARRPWAVEVTHGHPLALALVADLLDRGAPPGEAGLPPDVISALLSRLVESTAEPAHRRALEVCALSRVTTEALLRDVLGAESAADGFAWLRGLSCMEIEPDGLRPHDLAREVIDAELRWRDPETYAEVFRAVSGHARRRLRHSPRTDRQRAAHDLKYVYKNLSGVLTPVDWDTWGQHRPEPARPADGEAIAAISAGVGPQTENLVRHWWAVQPSAFVAVREPGGELRGFLALLDLTAADEAAVAADPATAAAWAYAIAQAPPRPGEQVNQLRFIVDRELGLNPSPTTNAAPVQGLVHAIETAELCWDFITMATPDLWDGYFDYAGYPRASGADFVVDGTGFGCFAHDFRRVPADAWMTSVTERALARSPEPASHEQAPLLVLSQPDHDAAVKRALRDLDRPDQLAANPLIRSRAVRDRAGDEPASPAVLRMLLREQTEALATEDTVHRAGERAFRAVDRTYWHGCPTQEAAAEVLGLPFSTYRRHLTHGIELLCERLWNLDVYGRAVPD